MCPELHVIVKDKVRWRMKYLSLRQSHVLVEIEFKVTEDILSSKLQFSLFLPFNSSFFFFPYTSCCFWILIELCAYEIVSLSLVFEWWCERDSESEWEKYCKMILMMSERWFQRSNDWNQDWLYMNSDGLKEFTLLDWVSGNKLCDEWGPNRLGYDTWRTVRHFFAVGILTPTLSLYTRR